MRLVTLSAAALIAVSALSPAFADEAKCNQPEASWQPVEALKTKLTGEGWTIKNVKTDEGCYEVYATDKDGKKVEVYFDPVTFEKVGEGD